MTDIVSQEIVDGVEITTYSNGTVEKRTVSNQPEPILPEPVNTVISKLAFLERFTQQEMAAFLSAAKQRVDVEVFKVMLDAATVVDLSYPSTVAAVNALEQAGIIGAGRAAEILRIQ